MDNLKIAFLSSSRFEDNSIRGAILVTDTDTKPVEFRITDPVRPTAFQRTLYGEILDEHILVELIGVPLLRELQEKPNFVLVQDEIFLGVNTKQEIPVIQLLNETDRQGKNVVTAQLPSSKFTPIRIAILKSLESRLTNINTQLNQLYEYRDLLEPFKRLEVAGQQVKK
jgi:hypothetical protein